VILGGGAELGGQLLSGPPLGGNLPIPQGIIDAGLRLLPGQDPITGQMLPLHPHRRRRRRRALTATDRADIAFVTGILGKTAGKEIAAIIAART